MVEKDISRMQDLRSLKSFLKDMCNLEKCVIRPTPPYM